MPSHFGLLPSRPLLFRRQTNAGGIMEGASRGTELQPCTICAQSGVYQATHAAHRSPHKVVVRKGDRFPQCNACGDAVRFHFVACYAECRESVPSRVKVARKRTAGPG